MASLDDFAISNAGPADAGTVLAQPGWSLYCLDDEGRNAVFVELPEDLDLTAVPFLYQTQFDVSTYDRWVLDHDMRSALNDGLRGIDAVLLQIDARREAARALKKQLPEAAAASRLAAGADSAQ